MIIKKTINYDQRGIDVLCISGVHGNESHAVAANYSLYNRLKENKIPNVANIEFILNVNEYGLINETRKNDYKKEDTTDCNRLFSEEYKTIEEVKEYIQNLKNLPRLILDIHNSPSCIPCFLIDYNENTNRLLSVTTGVKMYPFIQHTNIGTIKKYFNSDEYHYAYTMEFPEMGKNGNVGVTVNYLEDFITVTADNILNEKQYIYENIQQYIPKDFYTTVKHGILNNPLENRLYKKDEIIAEVIDLDSEQTEIIKAPYDGVLYDVNETLYVTNKKAIGSYGRRIGEINED